MTGYFSCNNTNAGAPSSPINSQLSGGKSILMRYLRSGLSLDHDQYSSPKISRPIVNYHYHSSSDSSRSPLTAVENLERSQLPATAKVHDDVLVMDGILIGSAARKGAGKLWSPANSDGGGSSSGSSGGYKTEACRSWEDTGICRYGHKCKFAHGQEELCPAHTGVPNRNKIIVLVARQPYFSPLSSNSSPLSTFSLETMRKTPLVRITAPPSKLNKASPAQSSDTPTASVQSPSTDWSPLDDGIAVTLPSSTGNPTSREPGIAVTSPSSTGTSLRKPAVVVTSPSSTGSPPSKKPGIVVTSPSSTGYPPLRKPGIVVTSPSSTHSPPPRKPGIGETSPSLTDFPPLSKPGIVVTSSSIDFPPLTKPGIVVRPPSSTGSPWRKPGIEVTSPSSTGSPPSRKGGGVVVKSPSSTGSPPSRKPAIVVTSPSSTSNPPSREAGIAVTSPSSTGNPPSREAVDEHIHNVLYGPSRKKRLLVFKDICPE